MHLHHYSFIAEQFAPYTQVISVHEFGNGNINDTYLVTVDTHLPEDKQFVLQRINTHVFKQPKLIMQNMRAFTEHMRRRASKEQYHWIMPRVLSTEDGRDYHLDSEGNFWRAITYVPG